MALKLFNDAGTHSSVLTASQTADSVVTLPDASGKLVIDKSIGRRNYLINGNFDRWDYGINQTSNGYGSDNRWYNENNGSTKTHLQVPCSDVERALFNATYFSRTQVSSVSGAGNLVVKDQKIENVTLLAGKTVTVSFWARSDANRNIAIEFVQYFGSGGNPSNPVSGIGAQLIPVTTTWQKKTITVTLPSIVGKILGTDGVQTSNTSLFIWFDAGSNFNPRTANLGQQSGTFDIAQVKLEDGPVATDGWHPYDGEFGSEVEACQRYYYKPKVSSSFSGTIITSDAGGNYEAFIRFPVQMRVPPSVTLDSTENYYVNWGGPGSSPCSISSLRVLSTDGVFVMGTHSAAFSSNGAFCEFYVNSSNALLAFNSEI
jgi:hypothetical protein